MEKVKKVTDYMWHLITTIVVLAGVIVYMYKQSISNLEEQVSDRNKIIEKRDLKIEQQNSLINELYQLMGNKQAISNLKEKIGS